MNRGNKGTLALALFLWAVGPAFAQFVDFPYYGKNKVVYEHFPWKSYPTEHFKIYFYAVNDHVLKDVAELSESAYEKVSQMLKHQLAEPVPLIYYNTYTDFEQTNLFEISEGVLGVSEPVLNRIGIHGDMPLDDLQALIEHELTHVFEFDILWGNQAGRLYSPYQPPLWTFEGLSEYATGRWTPWSSLIVRDAVLNDRIPEFSDSGEIIARYPLPREPAYDFGHAVYEFIESKYGANSIREFWASLKSGSKLGKKDLFKRAFNLPAKEFQFEFKKHLRDKNNAFLLRENPENYSVALGPEFPVNPYYFAFSHALSPSGDLVATITFNVKDMDIDIVLISTKDGSVVRNITPGYTLRYDNIKFEVDPSQGKNLAWSRDGDNIAFFARDGRKHSLFLVDALSGKIRKKLPLSIDQPSSPSFLPSDSEIIFSGFEKGNHDIFQVNLDTGSVTNLTGDAAYEKAPSISPDGNSVAYTLREGEYDIIFVSPLENFTKRTRLDSGKGNAVAPCFSPDSQTIFFSGDDRDAYNIYSINLETGERRRYTDVRTGNFYATPMPGDAKTIVFSSFNKGAIQIFKAELEGTTEAVAAVQEFAPETRFPRFKPALSLNINQEKIEPRKGVGKLYATSRPPVMTVLSSDGSVYGGSTITFSDLLGDHTLLVSAYQVRAFRSYNLAYINQKNRFQYMASVYQYTLFYYPDYYSLDPAFYGSYFTYQDAVATRKISGISLTAYYPFNKNYRAQFELGILRYDESFLSVYPSISGTQPRAGFAWSGNLCQTSASLIGETTFFKYFGPIAGNTFRLTAAQAIPLSKNFFNNTNLEIDARHYLPIGGDALFAFRFEGFACFGKNPFFNFFGGNNQIRSAYYNGIVANQGWYANAEFRFPLIDMASTILGRFGPLRGVLFADLGRAKIKGLPAKIWRYDKTGDVWAPKEYEAIGSFGYGIEFFLFGFPVHIEFVKGINIPNFHRPFTFDTDGKFDTNFWIGFDF